MPKEKRILFVEDDKIAKKMGHLLLAGIDCTIDMAERAAEALNLIEKYQYQVIFLDVGLPDGDGAEMVKAVRLSKTQNRFTPIIVMSARSDADTQLRSLRNGATEFHFKPLNTALIQKILQTYQLNHADSDLLTTVES